MRVGALTSLRGQTCENVGCYFLQVVRGAEPNPPYGRCKQMEANGYALDQDPVQLAGLIAVVAVRGRSSGTFAHSRCRLNLLTRPLE